MNAAGTVVGQHPPADAACPSTYFWLDLPAHSRAPVFRKMLPWKLSELPLGAYPMKARLMLYEQARGVERPL